MFENPRRGRQAGKKVYDKCSENSRSQIVSRTDIFRKLPLGAPDSHTDLQLIPLEKIPSSRDSVRKARESHLIDKAMTLEPTGLNRHDKLLLFFLF